MINWEIKETLEQIVAALVPLVENSEVVELGLQLALIQKFLLLLRMFNLFPK